MVIAVQRDFKGVLVQKNRPVVLWLSVLDQIYLLVYINLFTLLYFNYPIIFHLLLLTILLLCEGWYNSRQFNIIAEAL
jgi:hypothetical protein